MEIITLQNAFDTKDFMVNTKVWKEEGRQAKEEKYTGWKFNVVFFEDVSNIHKS